MQNAEIVQEIHNLATKLMYALQDKQAETSAVVYDELFKKLSSVFNESNSIHEHYLFFGETLAAMLKYLVKNNFYEKAHTIIGDIENLVKNSRLDNTCLEKDREKLSEILNEARLSVKSVPQKHRNLTIPRFDTKCCLCRLKPANKTGSHMVPNFLTAPTFSWDGKPKRNREALDHCFLNEMDNFVSYYGSEVPPERIEKTLGHEMTDDDIEQNINQIEFDNEFCDVCEKRFGVLETAYSAYYNKQNKELSPRVSYLFWLSVLWRMQISRMGVFLSWEDEKTLREILDANMLPTIKEIANSNSDLGQWKYAMFQATGLKDGDKGVLASRKENAPYVAMYNDLVMVFFPVEPSDEELSVGPMTIKRDLLNDWRRMEKCQVIDRRFFWAIRDWIDVSSYDYYDPAREQALLMIREEERTRDKEFSEKEKALIVKARRLSQGAKPEMFRLRKLDRFYMAQKRLDEANSKGEQYDPLKDEELMLTRENFNFYFEDLARLSRHSLNEQIKKFPFYEEARQTIHDETLWKYHPNDDEMEDKEYSSAVEWMMKNSSKKDLARMLKEPNEPYVRGVKIGRNDPCPCGSGKKYKKCCGRFL